MRNVQDVRSTTRKSFPLGVNLGQKGSSYPRNLDMSQSKPQVIGSCLEPLSLPSKWSRIGLVSGSLGRVLQDGLVTVSCAQVGWVPTVRKDLKHGLGLSTSHEEGSLSFGMAVLFLFPTTGPASRDMAVENEPEATPEDQLIRIPRFSMIVDTQRIEP